MLEGIDLNKYPNVKYLCDFLNNIIPDGWYVVDIDFKCSSVDKEYEYYSKLGLETKMGEDCSVYFTNIRDYQLGPTSYGDWCSLEVLEGFKGYPSDLDRLEYFLENKIFYPFRMEIWKNEKSENSPIQSKTLAIHWKWPREVK